MTISRFTYQADAVRATTGLVLNIGCDEDPAGLKGIDAARVINVDKHEFNPHMQRNNAFDEIWDVTQPWPAKYGQQSVELVVLGDIVEHLTREQAEFAFDEARRVSKRILITVPVESRDELLAQGVGDESGFIHRQAVSGYWLRDALEKVGWSVVDWQMVDYGFVPLGYFVTAL